ncbi:unnamed protein product [Cercopithifilaria johnstoni]|uniref:acid phosphatase n=1 Tax=Cercopithifilaria johnstoni TaxID=2874296 RepID=A0A8J2LTG6_9BILA|nr:unnamed protein product [Cercopithifilaria johnstoni]
MSAVGTDSAISNHHEGNDNSGILGRTINKSKVYPLEESAHSDICNDYANEKVSAVEIEEARKDDQTVSKQQNSLPRRNLTKAIIFTASIIAIALTSIAVVKFLVPIHSPPELVYINMIWRHGDRAPIHYFPKFTDKYMIAFPNGIENLTKNGAKQSEELGMILRRRYIHPKNITPEQIYIRSTNVNRTIETAQNVLKGMSYPNIKINTDLATSVDSAGNPLFDCPVARQYVKDQRIHYMQRENFSEIYELMERELNYSKDPYLLFDTLNCLREHDLVLPEWMKGEELYEKLKYLSWSGLQAHLGMEPYSNELQRKMRGGSTLRGVVSRIACKVNYSEWKAVDSCNERFYGLSAHDMTIASILSTFSDIDSILGKSPLIGFGAYIAFEIWKNDNLYEMKVLYANQWDENPRDITKFAPGCGNSAKFCNVNKFIKQSRPLFFDDIQKECFKDIDILASSVVKRSVGRNDNDDDDDDIVGRIEMY